MSTTVSTLSDAWNLTDKALNLSEQPAAKREFALAKTAIEDAISRVNRGVSIEMGFRDAGQFDDVELGDRTEWAPR